LTSNLGADLVAESIELKKAWVLWHKWLYYVHGEPLLNDEQYDNAYRYFDALCGVGSEYEQPPLPRFAVTNEEAVAYSLPLWDHLEQYRKRIKERSEWA
jgi:NAD-dependent DNA ligase